MLKKSFLMTKKQWLVFLVILVLAIAVPLTVYGAEYGPLTGGLLVEGNDPDPGSNGFRVENSATIGDFSIAFTGHVSAIITIPDGYTVTTIIVKGGNYGYVEYTGSWTGPTTVKVDNSELPLNNPDNPNTRPAISHITVWYEESTPDPYSITVNKDWLDLDEDDWLEVTVNLYQTGNPDPIGSADLNEENDWSYTFGVDDELELDADNEYYVEEETPPIPAGYTGVDVDIDEDSFDNSITFDITNDPYDEDEPAYTDITVNKVWRNDNSRVRPDSIQVTLKADGEVYESDDFENPVTLNADNGWSYTFSDLPVYTDNGNDGLQEIDYDVVEEEVGGRYTTRVVEDGNTVTITNTYNPPGDGGGGDEDEDGEEEIPDEDVPLDDLPEPPVIDIPDLDVPLDESPQTGDSKNYALLLLLAGIASVSLFAMRYLMKGNS